MIKFAPNDSALGPKPPEVFFMPGGEAHIKSAPLNGREYAFCSFGGSDDLLKLAVWADAVHRDGGDVYIGMPYLPGARQDRRQEGEALSAKVYADILNSFGAKQIATIDPHSDVMPALVNNLVTFGPESIAFWILIKEGFTGVIIPDAGAAKRATAVAKVEKLPTYQALKRRDPTTGKLSGFTCEPLPEGGRYLIVDDICDGGGTFLGLAKTINRPREELAIWVTHGIFSGSEKQNEDLSNAFGAIFTTNSHEFRNTPPSSVIVRDLYSEMDTR